MLSRGVVDYLPQAAPFLMARKVADKISIQGDAEAFFGNRSRPGEENNSGIFSRWKWDGKLLRARNDRFGFYPIYIYRKGGEIGLSPSIPALIRNGADATLNYHGLAVALRFGQFIGDDSPFEYIHVLPPNADLDWDGNDTKLAGGYDLRPVASKMDRNEAIDRYVDLFRNSILRRQPPERPFAVPLSGGRDSRHILFELVRNNIRPEFCLTYNTSPEDVRIAGLICARLNLKHVVVEESRQPYLDEVKKNWLTNFGVDEGSYPIPILQELVNRKISTIYDGIAGDVLSAGLFLNAELLQRFRSERPEDIAEAFLPADSDHVIARVLRPDVIAQCSRSMAVERLAQEIERHSGAHNPVTSFYFWNRTRRKIALTPYAMYASIGSVISPYLDHELFDFLISLPVKIIIDHKFHTETIERAYPELANVPYEDKSANSFDRSRMYGDFATEFAGNILFERTPKLMNPWALKSRLMLSRLSRSYGASQQWFLRRAAWCYQLGSLVQ
jgi:asparagine synthase (glutamine-hydrolysing)